MITADQLVLHAVGDYLIQSDWMAQNKTKHWAPALVHALTYSTPFLLLTRSPLALLVIASTHYLIDRYRLARYVVFAKNFLAPKYLSVLVPPGKFEKQWPKWERCKATGYDQDVPPWMSVWLLIIADNVLHVAINGAAIMWL